MPEIYEDVHTAIDRAIKSSPVVAVCICGNKIRAGEIEFGVANQRECAACVREYVMDTIGDY